MSETGTPQPMSNMQRAMEAARIEAAKKQSGAQTSQGSTGIGKDIPHSSNGHSNPNAGTIARLKAQLGEIEAQMRTAQPIMKAQLASLKESVQKQISQLEHSKSVDHER